MCNFAQKINKKVFGCLLSHLQTELLGTMVCRYMDLIVSVGRRKQVIVSDASKAFSQTCLLARKHRENCIGKLNFVQDVTVIVDWNPEHSTLSAKCSRLENNSSK